MPRKKDEAYNLVVIGGGSAGLVSAYIAAAVKAKVALIEEHRLGGDCLNTGCVPSKALIKSSRIAHQIRDHRLYGIRSASCEVDFAEVMERVQEKIRAIEPHDSVERYTALGVECIQGRAEVLDRNHVRVNGRVLRTKAIVLALGASPIIPKIPGIETIKALTSENLWDLRKLPKRLAILGAGPIGCEMAQAFQRLGSEVTLIDSAGRMLLKEDEDVASLIRATFEKEGIRVLLGRQVTAIRGGTGEKQLILGDKGETLPFDELLLATGRRANTKGMDWAKLGVTLNPDGTIKVDPYMRADGRSIYACGDVAGPYQFTHTASHQAWYCAVNALFSPWKKFKVDYRVIPWVTFTDPEIAQVGHNEASAKAAGIPYETTIYGIDDLDRAIVESEQEGRVKVLTVPGKDKILGASIVGAHAGELIAEFTTAMKFGLGLNKVLSTIHPYPTFSEANKYAAGNWKKAHAPEKILAYLRKYHAFNR